MAGRGALSITLFELDGALDPIGCYDVDTKNRHEELMGRHNTNTSLRT